MCVHLLSDLSIILILITAQHNGRFVDIALPSIPNSVNDICPLISHMKTLNTASSVVIFVAVAAFWYCSIGSRSGRRK